MNPSGGQKTALRGLKKCIIVYAGQYYDQETGLHYNYHRYYDPSLGRYLRADPIGLAGGINPYTYVANNPKSLIDFFGLSSKRYLTFTVAANGGIPISKKIPVNLSLEGGLIHAVDPCDPGNIITYGYFGLGPGFGEGSAATGELGILDVSDGSPNPNDPLGISGSGWAISWFKTRGVGISGQVYGEWGSLDTLGVNWPFGISIGLGEGISGLFTKTKYLATIPVDSLPKEVKDQ